MSWLSLLINSAYAQVTLLVPSVTDKAATSDINSYLGSIFPKVIQVGALIAIIAIAYEGIRMISTNIPGLKNLARSHLWDAVIGLILLLSAYLILQTINPKILEVRFNPSTGGVTNSDFGGGANTTSSSGGDF